MIVNHKFEILLLQQAMDHHGMTPLHLACISGHLPIVKLLVEKGVSLFAKDKSKSTPLHLASDRGSHEVN